MRLISLIRKKTYFIKILIIFVVILFLWSASHISYINLLFPLWVSLIAVWFTSITLFRKLADKTEFFLLFLWLCIIFLLLERENVLAEQLSVSVYFLLVFIFVKVTMKLFSK